MSGQRTPTMNNYRLRLILASACLSAALTVLTLKWAGFLRPGANPGDLQLLATSQPAGNTLSPWRVVCEEQIAMIVDSEQAPSPRRLLDPGGRLLACQAVP